MNRGKIKIEDSPQPSNLKTREVKLRYNVPGCNGFPDDLFGSAGSVRHLTGAVYWFPACVYTIRFSPNSVLRLVHRGQAGN